MKKRVDVLIVGNTTYDEIRYDEGGRVLYRIGGGVFHGSIIFSKKSDINMTIVSNLTPHQHLFYKQYLDDRNIIAKYTNNVPFFKLVYGEKARKVYLELKGQAIDDTLVPNMHFDIALIIPVYHEVSYNLLRRVKSISKIVALDLQGLVRKTDEYGRVYLVSDASSFSFVKKADIIHATYEEIRAFTGKENLNEALQTISDNYGDKIWIITESDNIIWIIANSKIYHEKPPSVKPVDETGAGDAFLTAFALRFYETFDVFKSVDYAKRVVAHKITRPMEPLIEI